VRFEGSLSITHQRMHKLYISLKFITLKHLKCSYMFQSLDRPQSTYPLHWKQRIHKHTICCHIT